MASKPSEEQRKGAALKDLLREKALALGLDAFGVAPIEPRLRRSYFLRWIAEGQQGEMKWLERNQDRRLEPKNLLPQARSICCVGLNYWQKKSQPNGRYATYALGKDYHKVLLQACKALCKVLQEQGYENKPYVDTGPVLEKPIAAQAGLGWQAKNTMLIHRSLGNWLFLGEIFTTADLPPDAEEPDHCGSCTRCLDACPTQAITAPYQLDARRCLAYLTIEHKGAIPEDFRTSLGDRLFGCEECLEVCPWNRWAQTTRETRFAARDLPDAREILRLDEASFARIFAGSAIKRTGLRSMQRNACVVLGNIGQESDRPLLETIANSDHALLAEHARWALDQISSRGLPSSL